MIKRIKEEKESGRGWKKRNRERIGKEKKKNDVKREREIEDGRRERDRIGEEKENRKPLDRDSERKSAVEGETVNEKETERVS